MRKILVIAAPIAVLVLMVLVVGFMQKNAPKPQKKEVEEIEVAVFVDEVRQTTITPHISTQGEVRARTEIDLVPQISGRIERTANAFVEGGIFKAGEPLVYIDEADYELAVVRSNARVADAEQALLRETAEAEMARRDWEELGEGDPSSLALREPQLAQAKANLESAKADLAAAELNLKRTKISVPFNGRVRSKSADLGQFVSLGTRLGRVFSTDLVQIRLPLTDRELGILGLPIGYERAEDADPIPVDLTAVVGGEIHNWTAYLARTDSAIDPQTRVLYCIVEVKDPYGAASDNGTPLAVGLFVNAEIPGKPLDNVLVIPRTALRSGDKVYVLTDENRLDIRTVTIDFSESDRVVIESGLEAGERVVVGALESAVQGMKLKALTPGEANLRLDSGAQTTQSAALSGDPS